MTTTGKIQTMHLMQKYAQSTPLSHKHNFHLPSRQLWNGKGIEQFPENFSACKNTENEIWGTINSPCYVDFCNLPEIQDTFFDVYKAETIKKQNPTAQKLPDVEDNNLFINSLHNSAGLNVNHGICQKIECGNMQNIKKTDQFVHFGISKQEKENIKTLITNPLPKLIKSHIPSTFDFKNIQTQGINIPNKTVKKRVEVWKKKPFIPLVPRRILKPKTPPLSTAVRAKEREKFNNALKEKEKQKETEKHLAAIAKEKRDKQEIALLRKQTVHKAQPIRTYKSVLPQVAKRPLTDPMTPILLKRRRYV